MTYITLGQNVKNIPLSLVKKILKTFLGGKYCNTYTCSNKDKQEQFRIILKTKKLSLNPIHY